MEVRELMSAYSFPGDTMPVIRGSALGALNGEPKWVEKVEELMNSKGMEFHSGTNASILKWIPSSNSRSDDVIMYAGRIVGDEISGNIIKASIAYYDGNYYYHAHSDYYENQISNVYVGDRGSDTETFEKLETLPDGTKIDGWKMF